jgi:hypothetical protein
MKRRELKDWLDTWRERYTNDDSKIKPLRGKPVLTADDLLPLFEWKYQGMWLKRTMDGVRSIAPDLLSDLTQRAFACQDELGALRILTLIPQLGPAGASAILMAHDPKRFTVMDVRAIKSLVFLGRWSPETFGTSASDLGWLTYLERCRHLASATNRSLRDVDRSLWAAMGQAKPEGCSGWQVTEPQIPPSDAWPLGPVKSGHRIEAGWVHPDNESPRPLSDDITFEIASGCYEIWFSDRIANEYPDLVDECADWLENDLGLLDLGQIGHRVLIADGFLTDEVKSDLISWWTRRVEDIQLG